MKKQYIIYFEFLEDDNAPEIPGLDDNQALANEKNHDNHMDIDAGHIPGADDTTLLSNVSDEFVLPPISTGKIKTRNFIFLIFLILSSNTSSSTSC